MSGYLQKPGSGGGGGTWGSITGTLSSQTDLQNALNLKYDASNPAGYITSSALSGYTPTSRTITINGVAQDLSTNRSWTVAVPTLTSELTNDSGFITSSSLTGYLQNNVGISGGTTLVGGTLSGDNLTLSSTSNATKGKILFGTSAYDEVNNRLGIGTNSFVGSIKLAVSGQIGGPTYSASYLDISGTIPELRGNSGLGYYSSSGSHIFYGSGSAERMRITSGGNVGIGQSSPTAVLHLKAGTATASTAPLKFTSGTLNTTAEAGAIEYNNTFHVTNSDAIRRHIVTAPNNTKVTASAPYTNDGYITINIGGTDFKVMTTA